MSILLMCFRACPVAALALLISGCGGSAVPTKVPAEANLADVASVEPDVVDPASIESEPEQDATESRPDAESAGHDSPSRSQESTAGTANEKPLDLTFDDIKFDIEPGDPFERAMLPGNIEALLGKRIRIRGYILPSFRQSGLTQFVLVRDNMECCFGPGAALYDCIRVEMEPGKATEFSIRPVAVEGVFRLDEFLGPDDKHLAIYYMVGEKVE